MKKTLALVLLVVSISAYGQLKRIQLTLSGNHPLIPSVEASSVSLQTPLPSAGYYSTIFKGSVKESFEAASGMNFGSTVDYAFSSRFFMSTGLGVSYLRYKRSVSVGLPNQDFLAESFENTVTGVPFGSMVIRKENAAGGLDVAEPTIITSAKSGQTSALYLQLPVLAGTSFFNDKLRVRGGGTLSWLMASGVYKPHYTPDRGIEEVKITDNESFSSLLISATMNASYTVMKKFAIDASVQQYFTPIYSSKFRTAGNARYTVIGLGVSYTIAP